MINNNENNDQKLIYQDVVLLFINSRNQKAQAYLDPETQKMLSAICLPSFHSLSFFHVRFHFNVHSPPMWQKKVATSSSGFKSYQH